MPIRSGAGQRRRYLTIDARSGGAGSRRPVDQAPTSLSFPRPPRSGPLRAVRLACSLGTVSLRVVVGAAGRRPPVRTGPAHRLGRPGPAGRRSRRPAGQPQARDTGSAPERGAARLGQGLGGPGGGGLCRFRLGRGRGGGGRRGRRGGRRAGTTARAGRRVGAAARPAAASRALPPAPSPDRR